MFKVPDHHRIVNHVNTSLNSTSADGCNGAFLIPINRKHKEWAFCIVSDGTAIIDGNGIEWQHVSVSIRSGSQVRTPTWDEMCKIKAIFWDSEDCVLEYHPPKSQYVNNHPNVLHLWRPANAVIPMPPSIFVGI
jgi:hypothetical protein